jgi:hypothetical protein
MSRMTLKERVGELNMRCVYVHQLGKDIDVSDNRNGALVHEGSNNGNPGASVLIADFSSGMIRLL